MKEINRVIFLFFLNSYRRWWVDIVLRWVCT